MTPRSKPVLPLASTASGGIGLLAIAWLATHRLTGAELGYFFSFLSFGSLVQLADLGLTYASLQTAGQLAGTARLRELPALAARVRRWNLFSSSFSSLVAAAAGWVTFSQSALRNETAVAWSGPWVAFLVSVYLNQLTLPGIALREGSGKVKQAWGLRLAQEWTAGLACLAALHLGGGLWSLAALSLTRATLAWAWLILGEPLRLRPGAGVFSLRRWMAEVWPFQWRVALSGLCVFFIFRAFAPLILLERGPVLAGQFGLAISLMNLLVSVTSAWPASNAARFATLIAGRNFLELRREFPSLLLASTALSAAAALVSALALWQLQVRGFSFALRLPSPLTTTIILGTAVVHHFIGTVAVLLRAEGREPLLGISVVGAIANPVAILLAARHGFPVTIALAHLLCATIGLATTCVIFWMRWRWILPSRRPAEGSGRPSP